MIVVLGGLRSGSSVVARILHNLGVWMGHAQAMPLPGFWQDDYEDVALAQSVTTAWATHSQPKVKDVEAYIRHRERAFDVLQRIYPMHVHEVGLKSQLLALYWPSFVRAALRADVHLRVVVTVREPAAADASLVQCAEAVAAPMRADWLAQMRRMNEQIGKALASIQSVARIHCEEPAEQKVDHLTRRLGIPINGRAMAGVI